MGVAALPGSHAVRVTRSAVPAMVAAPAGICAAHWFNALVIVVVPSGPRPANVARTHVLPLAVNVTIASPSHASAAVSAVALSRREASVWYSASAPNASGGPERFSPLASAGGSTLWNVRWSTSAAGDTNTASATGTVVNKPSTTGACSLAMIACSADGPSAYGAWKANCNDSGMRFSA